MSAFGFLKNVCATVAKAIVSPYARDTHDLARMSEGALENFIKTQKAITAFYGDSTLPGLATSCAIGAFAAIGCAYAFTITAPVMFLTFGAAAALSFMHLNSLRIDAQPNAQAAQDVLDARTVQAPDHALSPAQAALRKKLKASFDAEITAGISESVTTKIPRIGARREMAP